MKRPWSEHGRSAFLGRETNPHRLYRSDDRLLGGVIAGIAEFLGFSVTASRLAFVVLIFVLPFLPLVYLVLLFVLPKRPVGLYQSESDEAFWRTTTLAPSTSFSDIRYRFRDLEERLRSMEAYVTSANYEFERELRRPQKPI